MNSLYNEHFELVEDEPKQGMTPAQVKAKLNKEGKTLRQFCEEKEINYRIAQALLTGVSRGKYGEAHRAAVALGLKEAA